MITDIIGKLAGETAETLSTWSIVARIAVTVILSTIIGVERATKHHAAGVRTFMIVSLASTMAAIGDIFFIKNLGANFTFLSAATIIAVAIVSSNTILFSSKNQLKGLTTSVCLWINGIEGILIGLGLYLIAAIVFVVQIVGVLVFPKLEGFFKSKSSAIEVHIELKGKNFLQDFTAAVRKFGIRIIDIEANPAYANSGLGVYSMLLSVDSPELKRRNHSEILDVLSSLEYISYIEEIK